MSSSRFSGQTHGCASKTRADGGTITRTRPTLAHRDEMDSRPSCKYPAVHPPTTIATNTFHGSILSLGREERHLRSSTNFHGESHDIRSRRFLQLARRSGVRRKTKKAWHLVVTGISGVTCQEGRRQQCIIRIPLIFLQRPTGLFSLSFRGRNMRFTKKGPRQIMGIYGQWPFCVDIESCSVFYTMHRSLACAWYPESADPSRVED